MRPHVVLHESRTGELLADVRALRGIIDGVPHPIFVKDEECRFLIVNRGFCKKMGLGFDDLIGRDDYDFFPKDQADVFREKDLTVLKTGETVENEEYFTDGDGALRTILTGKSRLTLSNGRSLLIGCLTDISDFRKAEATIRVLADQDYLTGLPNRRAFSNAMTAALAAAARSSTKYSVLLIDLDGFKPINDAFGHSVGDFVLREIAGRLREVIRDGDIVARLGGDEFAVISQVREPSRQATIGLATRLLVALQKPIATPRGAVRVGASIGMALCPEHGINPDALLHAADLAMYRAKEEGRGTCRLYVATIDNQPERPV